MSKIEVNTVEPQCGTTLTLGGSGDTVALGSGASQTGFGRTGTVDWITTPKVTGDSPVTGVTGKGYFLNTTAGVITINLPAGSAGDIISMADYAETWDTYNITVAANGSEKIGGSALDATLDTKGQSVTFVYVDGVQGWINTMDSTSNVRGLPEFITASVSGSCNTLTTSGNCKVAKFVNPGTFTVNNIGVCAANNLVSYMVVGGGGGSGAYTGGGGAAGGFRETKSPVTPYTASPLDGYSTPGNRITLTATPYPITVGGGGVGFPGPGDPGGAGTRGADSIFTSITAAGGGSGGGGNAVNPIGPGGSGGGGSEGRSGGTGDTPSTTPAQGFDGGTGSSGPNNDYYEEGGGGGGATAVGGNGTHNGSSTATGGAGATTTISGTPTAYAGGGGGGKGSLSSGGSVPTGGTGGGGNGSFCTTAATAGTDATGGGGGGASAGPGAPKIHSAKNGGSGVVIIRYKFQ